MVYYCLLCDTIRMNARQFSRHSHTRTRDILHSTPELERARLCMALSNFTIAKQGLRSERRWNRSRIEPLVGIFH